MGGRRGMGPCELCGREGPLTAHHLIPRTLHSNRWFRRRFSREELARTADLCRDCHWAVHEHVAEKELGRSFNTVEALLAHPEIEKYVAWVRTRPGRHPTRRRR